MYAHLFLFEFKLLDRINEWLQESKTYWFYRYIFSFILCPNSTRYGRDQPKQILNSMTIIEV